VLLITFVVAALRLMLGIRQPGSTCPGPAWIVPNHTPHCGRLVGLRSLVLAAGFFQEISGLPASLTSLRLDRNVVYVRLLGAPYPAVMCASMMAMK
jgi:hypothetical protein